MYNLFISYFLFLILFIFQLFFGYKQIINILSLLVFFSTFIFIFISYKKFTLVSLYLLLGFFSTLMIGVVVDSGVYLSEVGEFSSANNTVLKGAFLGLNFFIGSILAFLLLKNSNLSVKKITNKNNDIFLFFYRFLTLSMGVTVLSLLIIYGFPFRLDVHRADYWALYAPSWGGVLVYWLIQMPIILGYSYFVKSNKIDLFIFIFILVVCVLAGNRFTGLIQAVFYFFIPYFVFNYKKINITNIKYFLGLFFLTFLVYQVVLYSFSNRVNAGENLVNERAVLQAQMWWALDKKTTHEPKSIDVILNSYIGLAESELDKGVNYLMFQVSSASDVMYKISTGSSYTMSGFINHAYFLGYFGGVFANFIFGIIWGVIIYLLIESIFFGNLILIYFTFRLYVKFQNIIFNGNVSDIFSFSTLFFLGVILFFMRLKRLK